MTEDLQSYLRKIRSDAAECLVLSSVSNDAKGQIFLRTAEHLNGLASEIEKSIATIEAKRVATGEELAPIHGSKADAAPALSQQVTKSRVVLPWLLVTILGAISVTLVCTSGVVQKWWSPLPVRQETASTQVRHEASPPPQDTSSQAMMLVLFSSEQAERK